MTKSSIKSAKTCQKWTILVAAQVLCGPIQSVYPPRNEFMDKTVGLLNTSFNPIASELK